MTLAEQLADLLAKHGPGEPMDEGVYDPRAPAGLRHAAVLVPFIDRPQPTLLLTRRQSHMRTHAGQVAFPGGRADPADADSIATALREAQEEVGLPPGAVTVIGAFAPYTSYHRYHITPVVAVISPDLPLAPDPAEVAHIFEARCDALFDPAIQVERTVDWQGANRSYWDMTVAGERVWGVTANMLRAIGATLGLDQQPTRLNRGEG